MTVQHSTIYIKCPKCGENGLLIEMQGKYLCASCMFDYTTLKDDPAKLESVLIETMRQMGFGPVFASALYQRITLTTGIQANEHIQELARKNNIDLYQGHHTFIKIVTWLIKLFKR